MSVRDFFNGEQRWERCTTASGRRNRPPPSLCPWQSTAPVPRRANARNVAQAIASAARRANRKRLSGPGKNRPGCEARSGPETTDPDSLYRRPGLGVSLADPVSLALPSAEQQSDRMSVGFELKGFEMPAGNPLDCVGAAAVERRSSAVHLCE
jgi:hypothetical protein